MSQPVCVLFYWKGFTNSDLAKKYYSEVHELCRERGFQLVNVFNYFENPNIISFLGTKPELVPPRLAVNEESLYKKLKEEHNITATRYIHFVSSNSDIKPRTVSEFKGENLVFQQYNERLEDPVVWTLSRQGHGGSTFNTGQAFNQMERRFRVQDDAGSTRKKRKKTTASNPYFFNRFSSMGDGSVGGGGGPVVPPQSKTMGNEFYKFDSTLKYWMRTGRFWSLGLPPCPFDAIANVFPGDEEANVIRNKLSEELAKSRANPNLQPVKKSRVMGIQKLSNFAAPFFFGTNFFLTYVEKQEELFELVLNAGQAGAIIFKLIDKSRQHLLVVNFDGEGNYRVIDVCYPENYSTGSYNEKERHTLLSLVSMFPTIGHFYDNFGGALTPDFIFITKLAPGRVSPAPVPDEVIVISDGSSDDDDETSASFADLCI